MRMTNKIMQNNSLYNINNNKILQDKLSTQMSTQKKLTRPSDDPVVAIRALRLRTSVSELTQYYEKNAPDADSWLDVTGKALSTVTSVLTDLSKQANKGANKDLTADDLAIITEQMKCLRDEFYSTGNSDYAGRYVFTGYRTDSTMSFTKAELEKAEAAGEPVAYDIKENTTFGNFDTINYTQCDNTASEQNIVNADMHRLRLSYDALKNPGNGTNITYSLVKNDGTEASYTAKALSLSSSPDPYETVRQLNAAGTGGSIFIPETGEILFSDSDYNALETTMNGTDFAGKDTVVKVNYTKDDWSEGDLRPEHYFECTKTSTNPDIPYNTGGLKDQAIEYDVGYNQKIRVNTTASEVFTQNLDRDIDDVEQALTSLQDIEKQKTELELKQKQYNEGTAEYEALQPQIDAVNKAYSYIRENVHNIFEKMITKSQNYLDATNVAITDNGTRSSRLDLISNRLMDQQTTFETLQSKNEDADIADVAVKLTSTELTYNAALMATGKIMQTSLMNYI